MPHCSEAEEVALLTMAGSDSLEVEALLLDLALITEDLTLH